MFTCLESGPFWGHFRVNACISKSRQVKIRLDVGSKWDNTDDDEI